MGCKFWALSCDIQVPREGGEHRGKRLERMLLICGDECESVINVFWIFSVILEVVL